MAYKFSKGKRGFGDITFEDDADTGIDFEADTVKIETGGAERVIVTNTGLGVGGSPSCGLHVKGNDARVRIDGDTDSHPGLELSEDGTRKWIIYNDYGDDKMVFKTNTDIHMVIEQNGKVGIGVDSPNVPLHINGGTDAVRDSSGGGYMVIGPIDGQNLLFDDNEIICRNGLASSHLYIQNDSGNVQIGSATTPTDRLEVNGSVKATTSLKAPLIEYTDGDNAITIEDGGLLKVNAGIRYNRSVQVSSVVSPSANGGNKDGGWIKFATFNCPGSSNLDTAASTFLITLTGFESSSNRKISGLFMVHARFTNNNAGNGNGGTDYYDTDGTYLYCDPWNAEFMSGTGANAPNDFDPATDLLMIFTNDDATPVVDLYIKACAKDKHCYVSHLGSSSDTSSTDSGWEIITGQSWAVTEPAAPGGSVKVGGSWSSKIHSNATIKETLTVEGMLETKAMKVNVRDVNSTSTIQDSDHTLRCIQNSAITLTLPAKSTSAGRVFVFKDALGNANSNNITIDGDSSDTIDGSSTYVISHNKESITLTCDGINGWMITSRIRP